MVQLTPSSIPFVLERLNWPVRLARLQAARQFAELLSSPASKQESLAAYLKWLGSRRTENEICSGLAVLFAAKPEALPPVDAVTEHVQATSLLAEFMLREVYGPAAALRPWTSSHSDEVPPSFEMSAYFKNQRSSQVPGSLGEEMVRLGRNSGAPFMKQWAYEWDKITASVNAPLSGFPYHFLEASLERSGVSAQIYQRQNDVFRSAYLRTLHCAVDLWGMPTDLAIISSQKCLPINRGLFALDPIDRPHWLGKRPDASVEDGAPLEQIVRDLLRAGADAEGLVPVHIDIPLSLEVSEFATLSISSVLTSESFVPLADDGAPPLGGAYWNLPDGSLFSGPARQLRTVDCFRPTASGRCLTLCVDLLPLPFGYWHGDLFHLGLSLPASYVFDGPISYRCSGGAILTEKEHLTVGRWRTWNDHWTPFYAKGGHSRCGCLSEMRSIDIGAAADRLSLKVGWIAVVNNWHREKSYDDLKLSRRRIHFLDDRDLIR